MQEESPSQVREGQRGMRRLEGVCLVRGPHPAPQAGPCAPSSGLCPLGCPRAWCTPPYPACQGPRPNPGCGAGVSFVRWLHLLHRESGLTSPRASALGPSLQGSLLALTCLGVLECPGRPKQEQAEKRGHRWPRSQVWFSHARPEKEKGRLGGEGPAPGSFPATGGPGNVGWPSAERVTNPTLAICWAGWAT